MLSKSDNATCLPDLDNIIDRVLVSQATPFLRLKGVACETNRVHEVPKKLIYNPAKGHTQLGNF